LKNFLFTLLFSTSLFADSSSHEIKSFEAGKKPKVHVEAYDFSGSYPQLENIAIDATRQMRVTMDLSGDYPLLKKINYEGTFGSLVAKLTGHFPALEEISFRCSSTAMKLDLNAPWEKNCTIHLIGGRGDLELHLPKNVGIVIHTKVGVKGRVINKAFEKKGRGILKKTYINPAQENAPIQLTLNIEMGEGRVILN
jgi:hypothetical protein